MSGDTSIYAAQGFGGQLGMGRAPALLIVDFVQGFADPGVFGGGNIPQAIAATVDLLAFARQQGLLIVHTRVVYADDGSDGNAFTRKVPSLLRLTEHDPASQIVKELSPRTGELIVRKRLPSAFAETGLAAWLAMRRVDTVIVAGCTTSGCVRASVVDAMGAGMRVVVAADCVGDRAPEPHEANLFDMAQKYADVVGSGDVRGMLAALA
ncbi:isochorismatase family protein [Pigmentiphaga sp. YJ18]|uniref:isochorismatase family protein n=1 Tax=Pigmentiphaga sp. YJ18 TaxID=3134907 RepID=UPI0031147FB1